MNDLVFYALVVLIAYLAFRIVQPLFMALAWAGVLVSCAHPVFRCIRKRWTPGTAAMLSTVLVTLLLVVPAIVLTTLLVQEAGQFIGALQHAAEDTDTHQRLNDGWQWLQAHVPLPLIEDVDSRLAGAVSEASGFVAKSAAAMAQNAAVLLFHIFVALVATFFLLRDGNLLMAFVRKVLPFDKQRNEELINQTADLIRAGTMTTLAVAVVQGLAGGLAFAVLGLKEPVLWGFVMGFCALLPVVGTALVWFPAAVWLLAMGFWARGAILLTLGILLIGAVDHVLRPLLMSGKSTMNGLLVLISIMGGLIAFGIIGLVIGPAITAAAITMLHVAVSGPRGPLPTDRSYTSP